MSDIQFIDVDHEDFEDAPRALREAYKQLKKQYTTVAAERDDFRGKWQSKSADDALAGFGFRNPKRVSKDLLADGVDLTDADAVKAWVDSNGDDYAKGEVAAPAEQQDTHADEAEQRRTIQDAASSTTPSASDKLKAALAEITPEMTGEDVKRVYQKHGI